MSEHQGPIEHFVTLVRRRLNRHRLWTTLVWTVVADAGLLLILGLWYTLRGYAVPGGAIAATAAIAAMVGLVTWSLRQFSIDAAARASDQFFRLHDAIASYLHFSHAGRQGGYYSLQAAQTRDRVEPLDPQSMRYEPPKRGIVLAVCLVAIAIPLSLRGPSETVLQQQALEVKTKDATAVINKSLAEKVDELRKETADPNENA